MAQNSINLTRDLSTIKDSNFTFPYNVLRYALIYTNDKPCKDIKAYIVDNGPFFGVFVGITRSHQHTILTWPKNIHGSIGYWDMEFKEVNADILCEKIYEVARSATQTDSRRAYFPELITDPKAILDIKFMKLPLQKIDSHTGKYIKTSETFQNVNDGLLLQSPYGRATYLPGVFPTGKWEDIKLRLQNKASTTGQFYGYKTDRLEIEIGRANNNDLACNFLAFIDKAVSDNKYRNIYIPFEVSNGIIKYKENENVRNISVLADVFTISDILCQWFSFSPVTLDRLIIDLAYYSHKYMSNPQSMRQASIFLLNARGISSLLAQDIQTRLLESLDKMEPQFELGEALMALQLYGNHKVLNTWIGKLRKPSSVFELNWQAQFLYARRKTNQSMLKIEKQKIEKLRQQLTDFVALFNTSSTETNYYAVAFEADAALNISPVHNLWNVLVQRVDRNTGLFRFLNGTARIDISGHVYRALIMTVHK